MSNGPTHDFHIVTVLYWIPSDPNSSPRETWSVHETRQDADVAYAEAIAAGAYTASICRVIESTDYF